MSEIDTIKEIVHYEQLLGKTQQIMTEGRIFNKRFAIP